MRAGFDDQLARRDHCAQLGIAKYLQQSENISGDRLLVHRCCSVIDVSTDHRRLDSRVEGCGIKRQHATFAITHNSQLHFFVRLLRHNVDGCQNLLEFVANDMPSNLEG